MGDLGGAGDGLDAESGADAAPQPEDQSKLDDLLGGADKGPDEPAEGFDKAAQSRLLNELRMYKARGEKRKATELLESIAARIGKNGSRDDYQPVNQYAALLEGKELDGLSGTAPLLAGSVYNPNGDERLLIEWSVPKEERDSAISEVRALLMEDVPMAVDDDGAILAEDLPIA